MSLTRHLDSRDSPVRRFLYDRFPDTKPALSDCQAALASAQTIEPNPRVSSGDAGLIGHAIDYRIRYYFAVTPTHQLVAYNGATIACDLFRSNASGRRLRNVPERPLPKRLRKEFFASLEDTLTGTRPVRRRLERVDEEILARYCITLAYFEQVYRRGGASSSDSPLFLLDHPSPVKSVDRLLALAQPHWIADLCNLSWAFYDRYAELLTLPTVLNPKFLGSPDVGGADADLIIDGCLIDIKTKMNPMDKLAPVLYQLLGYALLDYADVHEIQEVGIYFARQAVLVRWALTDLIRVLGRGDMPTIESLREQFEHVAQSSQRGTPLAASLGR